MTIWLRFRLWFIHSEWEPEDGIWYRVKYYRGKRYVIGVR